MILLFIVHQIIHSIKNKTKNYILIIKQDKIFVWTLSVTAGNFFGLVTYLNHKKKKKIFIIMYLLKEKL